jgi:hypothetical protein
MFWHWFANEASPKIRSMLALSGAVLLLGIGVYLLTNDVKCGTATMSATDVCDVTEHGTTIARSYDEQRSGQALYSRIALIGGALLAPVAPVMYWRHRGKPSWSASPAE